jgi:hypothetical protein
MPAHSAKWPLASSAACAACLLLWMGTRQTWTGPQTPVHASALKASRLPSTEEEGYAHVLAAAGAPTPAPITDITDPPSAAATLSYRRQRDAADRLVDMMRAAQNEWASSLLPPRPGSVDGPVPRLPPLSVRDVQADGALQVNVINGPDADAAALTLPGPCVYASALDAVGGGGGGQPFLAAACCSADGSLLAAGVGKAARFERTSWVGDGAAACVLRVVRARREGLGWSDRGARNRNHGGSQFFFCFQHF